MHDGRHDDDRVPAEDCGEEWAAIAADWLSQLLPRSAKLPADDEPQTRVSRKPAARPRRH